MKSYVLFVTCVAVFSRLNAQQQNDTTAIKKLLETESATWRSGDSAAHAACWQIRPYSKVLFSTADGKSYDVPVEMIVHPPSGMMGQGGVAVNSNYQFALYENNAWVSHDEKSTTKDGSVTYTHEIRMLEKISGQWKLVATSVHVYTP